MTNLQIQDQIKTQKAMLGEYVSRMNPLLPDCDPVNAKLFELHDICELKIDRLERSLAARQEVAKIQREKPSDGDLAEMYAEAYNAAEYD